jgi:flavin reductase (NADH)
MLLVCTRSGSPTLAAVKVTGIFAVNLLHGGAQKVATLFASGDPGHFDAVRWEGGEAGPHLTDYAHVIAGCQVSRTVEAGSHTVVLADICYVIHRGSREKLTPLLYGRRNYRRWQDQATSRSG